MKNNCPIDEPDSLEDLCIKQCVSNIHMIAEKSDSNPDLYTLKPNVFLLVPSVCDKLFQTFQEYQSNNNEKSWDFIGIFDDTEKTRLCKVNLFKAPHESQTARKREDSAKLLQICLKHPLKQLNFVDCNFSCDIFNLINSSKAKNSLLSLSIEGKYYVDRALETHFIDLNLQIGDHIPDIKLDCPQLQRLVLRDVRNHDVSLLPGCDIVHLFSQLTHLDLSRCSLSSSMISSLPSCQMLVWLNLNRVQFQSHADFITSLCSITKLRHLDISSDNSISQSNYPNNSTFNVETALRSLLLHLPQLVSLDLSGTNLAGKDTTVKSFKLEAKSARDNGDTQKQQCSIPGLEGRYFEFLGLYNCPYESYSRDNLPAKEVTGNKNEEQLLLALRRYVDRRDDIDCIFNQLLILFKMERVINQYVALEGILAAMRRHPDARYIQISGSASLFYIMKGEQKQHIPQKQKRILIDCLLTDMEDTEADHSLIRNCCLALYHLNKQQDVLYYYKRMITILLKLNHEDGQDDFIQRITLCMINNLARQFHGEEKKVVGDLGAIKVMLQTIRFKLFENKCDEIMEMAWSTMWNATDETAVNCDRFMDQDGMVMFIQCLEVWINIQSSLTEWPPKIKPLPALRWYHTLQKFPEKSKLLKMMMGLMNNIAEVQHLRPRLMEESFINRFCHLLDYEKDGIEVSYISAGVFSHMMADGPEAWTVESPSRDEVTEKLISAIERWPLKSSIIVIYRSFVPILKLIEIHHALGAQYWSVWALCNLTTVYPQKYCLLLKKEGGEAHLNNILSNPDTNTNIQDLARQILKNITMEISHSMVDLSGVQASNESDEGE